MVRMPQTSSGTAPSGRGSAARSYRPSQIAGGSARTASSRGGAQRKAPVRVSSVRVGDLNRTPREKRQRPNTSAGISSHLVARLVIVVAVIVVLGIGGAFLYNSNTFSVEEVRVSGGVHLTSQEMTDLAAVPSDTTLLRVDSSGIVDRLKSNPWVQSASVNRLFPHTLEISITERGIAAIVAVTGSDKQTENWAIASDGMWLMKIPDQNSTEGKSISQQVYTDAEQVLHITDVPYGVKPEAGAYCTDSSVLNALNIVSGLTTSLADEVTTVSATDTVNTVLTLQNGVQIAFGTADDIRAKERVCLQLMEQYPDQIAYINVRVVDRPTWRAMS